MPFSTRKGKEPSDDSEEILSPGRKEIGGDPKPRRTDTTGKTRLLFHVSFVSSEEGRGGHRSHPNPVDVPKGGRGAESPLKRRTGPSSGSFLPENSVSQTEARGKEEPSSSVRWRPVCGPDESTRPLDVAAGVEPQPPLPIRTPSPYPLT